VRYSLWARSSRPLEEDTMVSRRRFLAGGLAIPAISSLAPLSSWAATPWQPAELVPGAVETARLETLPGKVALIKRSYRPPNFETPIEYFRQPFTRNEAFFVRYHLAGIPRVDARTWRLKVAGEAAQNALELDLAALSRDFEVVEVAAVCQCSGNRRGLFIPHVQGVEWGVGAMGNARWKGVRLRDVLNKAGVHKEAVEVAFDGADMPAIEATPDFVKSLPIERALDENTLIAFAMNGKPLPHWNGFPARLVVPGWTATYWVKQLIGIDIRSKPLGQFWMNPAYRIPRAKFPGVDRFPTQENADTQPITDIVVNSLVTSHFGGEQIPLGKRIEVAGIAWDGGRGIRSVLVSTGFGHPWQEAQLGRDFGRFSFRTFSCTFRPTARGPTTIMVKAVNGRGDSQSPELIFNPAGYHHNVIARITIEVV